MIYYNNCSGIEEITILGIIVISIIILYFRLKKNNKIPKE